MHSFMFHAISSPIVQIKMMFVAAIIFIASRAAFDFHYGDGSKMTVALAGFSGDAARMTVVPKGAGAA